MKKIKRVELMRLPSEKYPRLATFINKVWDGGIDLEDVSDGIPEDLIERSDILVTELLLDIKGYMPHNNSLEFDKIRNHRFFNDFRYVISDTDPEIIWENN